ncbi:MAG: hypothetical protein C0506_00765 [Anaerolinea sp.]|nr:hypothetical protein [Anaerolinea sp.]
MTPYPDRVLMVMAGALGALMAEVRTPFGAQTAGLSAALAGLLAQEWDRAAARLVEENTAVTGLLERARLIVTDEALHVRIDTVIARIPASDLRVSALRTENDELRGVLVDVHAAVDGVAGEQHELLNRLIWDELRESTRRRHLVTGR